MLRTQIDTLHATEHGEHRLEALRIAWHQQLNLTRPEDVARIIKTANAMWTPLGFQGGREQGYSGCKLIVLDTFKRLHTAQENDATEMQVILDRMDFIRENTGAAIIFNHHATKPRPDMPATIRGSTVIEGSVDNIFRITKKKHATISKVEVEKARAIQPPDFRYEVSTEEIDDVTHKHVRFVDSDSEGPVAGQRASDAPSGPDQLRAFFAAHPLSTISEMVEWGRLNGYSRSSIYRWLKEMR